MSVSVLSVLGVPSGVSGVLLVSVGITLDVPLRIRTPYTVPPFALDKRPALPEQAARGGGAAARGDAQTRLEKLVTFTQCRALAANRWHHGRGAGLALLPG
jgi:hypothetical protein